MPGMQSSRGWRPSNGASRPASSASARATGSTGIRSTRVRFVDTTILLYAISRDSAEVDKAARANAVLDEGDVGLSVQVLQEFYVQAIRASRPDPLAPEDARLLVDSFRRFPVQDVTSEVVTAAMRSHEQYGVSYWDAAILEAARELGCGVVLSEDLSDGRDYGGVLVTNPLK